MNETWKCAKCETNNYSGSPCCFICGMLKKDSEVWEQELEKRTAVMEMAVAAARKKEYSNSEKKTDELPVSGGVRSVVIKPEPEEPERIRPLSWDDDEDEDERIFHDASDKEDLTPEDSSTAKNVIKFVIFIILISLIVGQFLALL